MSTVDVTHEGVYILLETSLLFTSASKLELWERIKTAYYPNGIVWFGAKKKCNQV